MDIFSAAVTVVCLNPAVRVIIEGTLFMIALCQPVVNQQWILRLDGRKYAEAITALLASHHDHSPDASNCVGYATSAITISRKSGLTERSRLTRTLGLRGRSERWRLP
jgi:hypothetical protein